MFRDISLNSIEDIYDFLWQLDFVYMQYQNGNEFANCLYNDFLDLIEQMEDYEEGLAKYIKLYHDVQIGKVPLREYDNLSEKLGVTDIISLVTGEELSKVEERLHYEITEMYEFNKLTWLRTNKNKYKDIEITYEDEKDKIVHINEDKLIKLDYMIKYTHHANRYKDDFKPSEIEELEEYREIILKNIDKYKKLSNKYKGENTERYTKYRGLLSKFNAIKIQIDKDIGELKRHYNLPIGKQNQYGRRSFVSYNSGISEIADSHENSKRNLIEEQIDYFNVKYSVGKLHKIAEKKLTERQLMIYKLYYENGLTQREIADIMGERRDNIKNGIKAILKKINKNL